MIEQHNHHCRITAAGYDWTIEEVVPGKIKLRRRYSESDEIYSLIFWIDIRDIDWVRYANATVASDYAFQEMEREYEKRIRANR